MAASSLVGPEVRQHPSGPWVVCGRPNVCPRTHEATGDTAREQEEEDADEDADEEADEEAEEEAEGVAEEDEVANEAFADAFIELRRDERLAQSSDTAQPAAAAADHHWLYRQPLPAPAECSKPGIVRTSTSAWRSPALRPARIHDLTDRAGQAPPP